MSRYIDAEKLIEKVNNRSTHLLNEWDTLGVLVAIDETPTADVEEVRHGKWVVDGTLLNNTICSCCHKGKWKGYIPTPEEATEWMPICPNCGAKMNLTLIGGI